MQAIVGLGVMTGLVGLMVGPAFIARQFFGVGDPPDQNGEAN